MEQLRRGQVIKINEFCGCLLQRVVWDVIGDRVLICDDKNYCEPGASRGTATTITEMAGVSETATINLRTSSAVRSPSRALSEVLVSYSREDRRSEPCRRAARLEGPWAPFVPSWENALSTSAARSRHTLHRSRCSSIGANSSTFRMRLKPYSSKSASEMCSTTQ